MAPQTGYANYVFRKHNKRTKFDIEQRLNQDHIHGPKNLQSIYNDFDITCIGWNRTTLGSIIGGLRDAPRNTSDL